VIRKLAVGSWQLAVGSWQLAVDSGQMSSTHCYKVIRGIERTGID